MNGACSFTSMNSANSHAAEEWLVRVLSSSLAIASCRVVGRHIPDDLLKHISPLSWEHINLTGIYSWDTEQQMPEGFRSLRIPGQFLRAA